MRGPCATLERLCNPNGGHRLVRSPFQYCLDNDGDKIYFRVATDGKVLVAIESPAGENSYLQPQSQKSLHQLLSISMSPRRVELQLDRLRAWCGAPFFDGRKENQCTKCGGDGAVRCEDCLGSGVVECTCTCCGDTHLTECEECRGGRQACEACDGEGYWTNPLPVVPGRFDQITFNRVLLARALATVEGDRGTLALGTASGTHQPIKLHGSGWRIAVMPMSVDPPDDPTVAEPYPIV
jgi:hypothetical protein